MLPFLHFSESQSYFPSLLYLSTGHSIFKAENIISILLYSHPPHPALLQPPLKFFQGLQNKQTLHK